MNTSRALALLTCILLAPVATGCGSTGTKITPESRELRFDHYSMALPLGWSLTELDEASEAAVAELSVDSPTPTLFVLRVFLNTFTDREGKTRSAGYVAQDFRDSEERIMITEGVEKGLYRLENVVKTEEVHGGKVFHAMHYVTTESTQVQSASLYLYFPHEERVREFIVIHCSETMPPDAAPSAAPRAEFLQTLASLRTNEGADSAAR